MLYPWHKPAPTILYYDTLKSRFLLIVHKTRYKSFLFHCVLTYVDAHFSPNIYPIHVSGCAYMLLHVSGRASLFLLLAKVQCIKCKFILPCVSYGSPGGESISQQTGTAISETQLTRLIKSPLCGIAGKFAFNPSLSYLIACNRNPIM